MVKFKFILSVLLIACFGVALGQQFETQLSANQIELGQRLKVSYVLNEKGTNFRGPKFNGFQILSGPNQSTSMQIINGNVSSSITFSYILQAVQVGTFKINGAQIESNGKTLTSNTLNVTVTKSRQNQPNTQQPSRQNNQPTDNQSIENNLFIQVTTDKKSVFVGQELVLTYKVFTRLNIVNNSINEMPDFTGFWAQDIESAQIGRLQQTTINGVAYNVATIKQTVLIPQKSGDLKIEPLAMDMVVRLRDNGRPRSIFDQFFGGFKDVNYTIKSNALTIQVLPLPNNAKPKNFNGAVGNFSIAATINKDSVEANDAINFKITYTGNGNIKFIGEPELNFPPDFEVYDPKVSEKTNVTAAGINGSKSFEYLIIPRHEGNFDIPALQFSYFDVKEKKYKTISTKKFNIQVGKSAQNNSNATAFRNIKKEEIKMLAKDIRFIKTERTALQEKGFSLFNSKIHWGILMFLLFGLLVFLFGSKPKQQTENQLLDAKSKKAAKLANQKLKLAQNALKSGNTDQFYEMLLQGLYTYFSDKLVIPFADLNQDTIETALTKHNTPSETIQLTKEVINICEMARYAPASQLNEQATFNKASKLIQDVEKAI